MWQGTPPKVSKYAQLHAVLLPTSLRKLLKSLRKCNSFKRKAFHYSKIWGKDILGTLQLATSEGEPIEQVHFIVDQEGTIKFLPAEACYTLTFVVDYCL